MVGRGNIRQRERETPYDSIKRIATKATDACEGEKKKKNKQGKHAAVAHDKRSPQGERKEKVVFMFPVVKSTTRNGERPVNEGRLQ